MPRHVLVVAVLAVLPVLTGCREFHAQVELTSDGGGHRTVFLETEEALPAELAHLLAVDGAGWELQHVSYGDENRLRYRREQSCDDFAGWAAIGGVLLRGRPGDDIRLESVIEAGKQTVDGNLRYVYRETLRWVGMREELAAVIGDDYAAELRRASPDLPPPLVERCRGIMVAGTVLRWDDLVAAESRDDAGARGRARGDLTEEIVVLISDQLRREGVDESAVAAVAAATRSWDPLEGVRAALPGLEVCAESRLVLAVTMPGRITGGGADTSDGRLAVFRVDLARTLGAPVVLEVESGR